VIAAGPLVAGLIGAGVGAAVGGLVGALVDAGVPETEAGYYAEGVRRGGALVTVGAPDDRVNEVVRILDRYNPVDIDERTTTWRQSGWTGFDPNASDYDGDRYTTSSTTTTTGYQAMGTETATSRTTPQRTSGAGARTDEGEMTIEVVEEDLRVGKRQVEQGGVRVHKEVIERPVEEQVRLREEQVTVERRPVNRAVSEADLKAFQEGDLEVSAVREEVVVDKQPRVVEEVVIRKDAHERTETVRDTVRRTDVDIEQTDGGSGNGYNAYSSGFRQHFQSNYANRGYQYERYEPAYRYGYTLASEERYRGRDWSQIEADARRDWERNHRDSAWDDFKDAVRHGWQQVRQSVTGNRW